MISKLKRSMKATFLESFFSSSAYSSEVKDCFFLAPDRHFFVTGDQVSQLPGWQEGAIMSAQHVVEQLGGRRLLTVPKIKRAPNTRRLNQGRG